MLTKALAAEYRHRGVRVNGIAPGMVATDLSAGFTDFFAREEIDLSEFGRGQPVRAAPPDEIAATFAFVASADAGVHVGRDRRARRRRHRLDLARRSRSSSASARSPTATTRTSRSPSRSRCCSTPRARPKPTPARRCSTASTPSSSCRSGAWPYDDLPGIVVERLGLDVPRGPRRETTRSAARPRSAALDAAAARIAAGDARVVLLAGAEGTRRRRGAPERCRAAVDTGRVALRRSRRCSAGWSVPAPSASSRAIHCFPLYEHALRAHEGASLDDGAGRVGALWAGLSESRPTTRTRGSCDGADADDVADGRARTTGWSRSRIRSRSPPTRS